MKKSIGVGLIVMAGLLGSATQVFAFGISFDWAGLKSCTSGNPNSVGSPAFHLSAVPAGTAKINFRMNDNNVPDYNHGGGTVVYSGGAVIKHGSFTYQSPCPPDGRHTYTWTAIAYDKSGKKIGVAKASKQYP
jgi:hypothetical protein